MTIIMGGVLIVWMIRKTSAKKEDEFDKFITERDKRFKNGR